MTNKKSTSKETRETLEAACSALDYALDHAKALRRSEGKSNPVADALVQGLKAAMSAGSADATEGSLRGHVANSVTHLRASLKAMQDLKTDNTFLESTMRATARSLALLYPLTQTEGPILLVPRKRSKLSRRKAPVIEGRAGKRPPLFEVAVGRETETNFFTGFEGNISSGGLFIATYDVHPIDTVLSVTAKLPGGRVVAEEATVKWVREYNEASPEVSPGMGVVFDDLSHDEHREIDYFMTKRDAIFYEAV